MLVSLININCFKEEIIKLVFGCFKFGKFKLWKVVFYWYEELKYKYDDLGK